MFLAEPTMKAATRILFPNGRGPMASAAVSQLIARVGRKIHAEHWSTVVRDSNGTPVREGKEVHLDIDRQARVRLVIGHLILILVDCVRGNASLG